jgi:hypothetical protein
VGSCDRSQSRSALRAIAHRHSRHALAQAASFHDVCGPTQGAPAPPAIPPTPIQLIQGALTPPPASPHVVIAGRARLHGRHEHASRYALQRAVQREAPQL